MTGEDFKIYPYFFLRWMMDLFCPLNKKIFYDLFGGAILNFSKIRRGEGGGPSPIPISTHDWNVFRPGSLFNLLLH